MIRILIFILVLFSTVLNAQQYSLPSQPDRNLLLVNPAYAGSLEATVASLMYRNQWAGWEGGGTPVYQNFELHAPLKKQSMALGFQARNESIGLRNNTEFFFTYAHRIKMEESTLAFALKAGVQNRAWNNPSIDNDNIDAAFLSNSSFIPNVGFGVAYYNPKYFVGLSVPYFFGVTSNSDGSNQLNFNTSDLAYVISGGGTIAVNDVITLEPVGTFFFHSTLKSQLTAILNAKWNDMVSAGIGYRMNEGIIFNAAYFVNKQFSVGYSYDYNIGELSNATSGSHELGILYYFGYKVNTISPRDF